MILQLIIINPYETVILLISFFITNVRNSCASCCLPGVKDWCISDKNERVVCNSSLLMFCTVGLPLRELTRFLDGKADGFLE